MDARAEKLALARKKLKDHQDKKNQDKDQKCRHVDKEQVNDIIIPEQESSLIHMSKDMNPSKMYSLEYKQNDNTSSSKTEVDATEFLISSKRNLELQIIELQTKNMELENNQIASSDKYKIFHQKVNTLENELKNLNSNYNAAIEQLQTKDVLLKTLNDWKALVIEEKSDLQEQLEFTKTMLTIKETENDSLHSQLFNIQSQLDATQLQLQQLTTGALNPDSKPTQESLRQDNEMLQHKVTSLEQQLKSQLKDYQQINAHYENYVGELNEQLKSVTRKNEDLNRELQNLSNRENGLIEQISEMEIRIQNYNRTVHEQTANKANNSCDLTDFRELQDKYKNNQENLQQISIKYEELQKLFDESNAKMVELTKPMECKCKQSNEVSLVQLNADIASDKVAAQRATEQNKKLKQDLQGLEEAVLKMTKDKLELTEKIAAEKYLNRELTIKLAEIDQKANNLLTTLKAKDEEMIRLQATYRDIERAHEELMSPNSNSEHLNNNEKEGEQEQCETEENDDIKNHHNSKICEKKSLVECYNVSTSIPKGDAMLKLQERFLKIMGEVADLSDEKHRLEHIIMQLQNETDTICEYVALYQQQRSLLKKRDEERSAQIIMFKSECNRLQNQLDELTNILKRFAEDKELSSYFQVQSKHEEIQKVMTILSNLKTSSLLDPHKTMECNNFYPCSCCSGQLIDV